LGEGGTTPEANISPTAIEPPVAATVKSVDALLTASKENMPTVPSAGGNVIEMPTTVGATVIVPVASRVDGGAIEAPTAAEMPSRP
jgi:hypothetical protein